MLRDESFLDTSRPSKEPFLLLGPQHLGKEIQVVGGPLRWVILEKSKDYNTSLTGFDFQPIFLKEVLVGLLLSPCPS